MASARASALALLLASLPLHAQSPPAPPADLTVSGIVVNAATGAPIPRAMVTLHLKQQPQAPSQPSSDVAVLTDASGAFHFEHLPHGEASLTAYRPGFFAWQDDPHRQNPMLTSSRLDLRIPLRPETVVSGRVTDSDGDPIPKVSLLAVSRQVSDGIASWPVSGSAITDARGYYHMSLGNDHPFYLRVSGRFGGTMVFTTATPDQPPADDTFPPLYFPNAPDRASALLLRPNGGQEIHADFHVDVRPGLVIRGQVSGLDHDSSAGIHLILPDGSEPACTSELNLSTGDFSIYGVPAGDYRLIVLQIAKVRMLLGETPVHVAPPGLSSVAVSVSPSVDLSFRIHFTGASTGSPARPSPGFVRLHPQANDGPEVNLNLGSAFNPTGVALINNVPPGDYTVTIDLPSATIESIPNGSADLLDNPVLHVAPGAPPPPIEINAQAGASSVSGRVSPASDNGGVTVVMVSSDHPGLASAPSTVQPDGSFLLLAPARGAFTVYAWRGAGLEYRNPAALQSLNLTGVPVDVANGSVSGIQVPVADIPPQ